jgi:hypothetical protein
MSTEINEIIAFKGFDENLQCRGFQYEIGETYDHQGEVSACSSGFHACLNPFDVLSYYDITSRFAEVKVSGDLSYHADDSKVAAAKITVITEIKLPDFINKCINHIIALCNKDNDDTGDYSQLAASGNSSKRAASGNYSKLVASGDYSKLAASGNCSQLAASGNYSKLVASGDYSKLVASGNSSVAISSGAKCRVKGGKNCAMALTRWVESENRYRITVAYVGENGIKQDTWYKLNDAGEFVEVAE